ncbi:MAG: histidine phosphatase family protein [Clostridia bacterium]|nr:histidine phosphatase family protein [Clostridia bacterium]
MTEIYLVRHCEALGNIMRIFQGTTDLDISDLGAKQLEFLKQRFKDIKLDRVYTSPLMRTQKTAKAIIGEKKLTPELCEGAIEVHGGIVEGKPFAETFNSIEGLADIWNNHPEDFAVRDGEKMRDAYERIWNTVYNIAKENTNKTVAVATHGGVLRCLNCRLKYNDITRLKDTPWSENTAVTLLKFDEQLNCTAEFFDDVSHLPEDYINRKSRIVSKIDGDNK